MSSEKKLDGFLPFRALIGEILYPNTFTYEILRHTKPDVKFYFINSKCTYFKVNLKIVLNPELARFHTLVEGFYNPLAKSFP